MKKIVLTILFTIISNLQEINSREAFVVIENNYSTIEKKDAAYRHRTSRKSFRRI